MTTELPAPLDTLQSHESHKFIPRTAATVHVLDWDFVFPEAHDGPRCDLLEAVEAFSVQPWKTGGLRETHPFTDRANYTVTWSSFGAPCSDAPTTLFS